MTYVVFVIVYILWFNEWF